MKELTKEQLITLRGNSVYLKRLDVDMFEEIAKNLMNTSYQTKVLTSTPVVFTKSGIKNFIENAIKDSSRVDFMIYSVATDEMLGDMALNEIDTRNRSCNIRIAIDSSSNYGKGYGQEAMKIALNYGFGMLNIHKVELSVLPSNERAIRVYEKLGFIREGIRRDAQFFNHKYHDMIMMGLLENEFLEKNIDCA